METLFLPYQNYSTTAITLEITAVVFAVVSVLYSRKNNIKVYPTGLVAILISAYLLYKWELFGDFIVTIYYLVMSVYGWYLWRKPSIKHKELKISKIDLSDTKTTLLIVICSFVFVAFVYFLFDKFGVWWSYVDILTTGLFFAGMYLLARRKVEHWIFLLVADVISIPLYYYKGYTITAMLYFMYTFVAFFGYLEWKKIWNRQLQTL